MTLLIIIISLFVLILLRLVHQAIQKVMGYKWWYQSIYLWTPHWRFTRWVKFLISGRKCSVPGCTMTHYVDVHHKGRKAYDNIWWEWLHPNDLDVLCRHHHILEHGR
jgi:ABC-type proline/glycine betaine transport systems, periplasmic components